MKKKKATPINPKLPENIAELEAIAAALGRGSMYIMRALLGDASPITISLTPGGTEPHIFTTPPASIVVIITFPAHDGGAPGLEKL
jgi:hypothetical protein